MGLSASGNRQFPLEMPIFIHYRPSPKIAILNALVHLGALFCLLSADIPVAMAGITGTGVLVHYSLYLKRYLSGADMCFKLDRHNRWQLLRANREAVGLSLLPGPFVHPLLIALRFRDGTGQIHSCVLTRDNLDRQTLRRLRIRLRWQ